MFVFESNELGKNIKLIAHIVEVTGQTEVNIGYTLTLLTTLIKGISLTLTNITVRGTGEKFSRCYFACQDKLHETR